MVVGWWYIWWVVVVNCMVGWWWYIWRGAVVDWWCESLSGVHYDIYLTFVVVIT